MKTRLSHGLSKLNATWIIAIIFVAIGLFVSHHHKAQSSDKSGNISYLNSNNPITLPGNEPPDPYPHFNDGTYIVGKDIQPGTYRTRIAPTQNCYYARLNSLNTGDILANDNTYATAVIAIGANDAAFISKGCGVWTQNLSAITTDKNSFGDGIYIVSTDIEPGVYKNTGQTGCYWARLADFSGNSILENDLTNDPATIQILDTDKGFKSSHCGTWVKQ